MTELGNRGYEPRPELSLEQRERFDREWDALAEISARAITWDILASQQEFSVRSGRGLLPREEVLKNFGPEFLLGEG